MSPFFSEWMTVMFSAMVSGTAMAAGVYLFLRVLPRGFSGMRSWLWWIVGVKFLVGLFFLIPVPLPAFVLPEIPAAIIPAISGTASEPTGINSAPESSPGQQSFPVSPASIAFLVWSIGIAVYAVFVARQIAAVRQILSGCESLEETAIGAMGRRLAAGIGLSRAPRILVSDAVTAPLTTNPFRPFVVLPASLIETLSDAEIEMTLAHELAHIRRGDLLMAIPLTLAQAAFWFFPPVWLCTRAWDAARESACDEAALLLTQSPPAMYGGLLIKVIEADSRRVSLSALGIASDFHTLKSRLDDLRTFPAARPRQRSLTASLLAIGMVITLPLYVTAQNTGKTSNDARNLVRNAGFEEGAEIPGGWLYGALFGIPQTRVARDMSVRHTGQASLRFSKTAQTFAPVAVLSQTVAPVPVAATAVRLRVWVKAQNARKATVAVLLGGEDGQTSKIVWGAYVGEAEAGDKPASHDWKAYDAVVPLPAGTRSVTLAAQMYGSGTVWFDDVSASYETANTKGKSK
ncbi:MAG: M56 family metallopeptidase [Akkermansiaceae bacterium]|nr:M56 family metallopeptidase [Armatimonadota bacterium]